MKSRAAKFASLAGVCAAMFAGSTAAHADDSVNQYAAIYSAGGTGFGPQVWGVAARRSFVQIYGSVDLALNYTNSGGRSLTRVQSGNAWTSKFGFYGQEYLGNDTTVFFRLESGFTANNGSLQDSTTLFNRASFVGIDNPTYGKFLIGRTYSASGTAALAVDPFYANAHESVYTYMATTSDLGYGANADGANRVNNLINYTTPRFLTYFNAAFSYAFKSNQTVGNRAHTRGAGLMFNSADTMIGVSYSQTWCDPAVSSNCAHDTTSEPAVRTDLFIVSAQHDFGPFVAQAGMLEFVPRFAGDGIAKVYMVGLQKYVGRTLYRATVDYRDTTIKQDYAYGTTLGADYFLSKRTALYTRFSVLKNGPQSQLVYNYDTTAGGTTVGKGQTVTSVTLGMYHHF